MTDLLPSGVLWDMDGTIVDSEPYWMRAERELVESFGGSWNQADAIALVGADLRVSARVLQNHGVALAEADIIDRMTDRVIEQIEVEVPWRPGARALLQELDSVGVPCALVTMSLRRMAETVVSAMGFSVFGGVVGGDDVRLGKPDPEPYALGARLLGVAAEDCIAIEDSPTGLASAVASGAVAIGVPAHVDLPEHAGYTLWPTLEGKTVRDLGALFASARPTALTAGDRA